MLVTRQQIDRLLGYSTDGSLNISLYLNTDRRQMPFQRIQHSARRKIHEALEHLRRSKAPSEVRLAVEKEAHRIQDYLYRHLPEHPEPGLALFAGQAGTLWEVLDLPRPVLTRMVIDTHIYIQPLLAILSEYSRFGVVLLDRRRARLLEIYMGQVGERWDVFDDVPQKISAGGWYGLRERKQQRRTEGKVIQHFKHVADELFRLFQKNQFDKLIVGCPADYYPEFTRQLHPFLHQRLAGHLAASPDEDLSATIEKVRVFKTRLKRKEDRQLVQETLVKPARPDWVSRGLEDVARNVAMGEVALLLVAEDQSRAGVACSNCGWVGKRVKSCKVCGKETARREDVIEDLVEAAARQQCRIRFVETGPEIAKAEGVAAQLRYRVEA